MHSNKPNIITGRYRLPVTAGNSPQVCRECPTRNEPKPMSWPEGPTETDNFVFSENLYNNVIAKESL